MKMIHNRLMHRVSLSVNPELRYCDPFLEDSPSYRAVKRDYDALLVNLGLDEAHFGSPQWNPFSEFIAPDSRVFIKPNFVRHIHLGGGDLWSVIVSPVILKLTIDYAFRALTDRPRLIVGDAPLQTADFDVIARACNFDRFIEHYRARGLELDFLDLRRESCVKELGLKNPYLYGRKEITPAERFTEVNLSDKSYLFPVREKFKRFRVTQYDVRGMRTSHNLVDNKYLVHEEVLKADVIIGISKAKTHRKAGITAAMKNFVGINGHKDYLPHHTFGAQEEGGDEYQIRNCGRRLQSRVQQWRDMVSYSRLSRKSVMRIQDLFSVLRRGARIFARIVGTYDQFGEGSWYGNDTVWRTVADLNRIVYHADKSGVLREQPQRVVWNLVDGIKAGDQEGPMEPRVRPVGLLAAGHSSYLVDYALCAVMGFDWRKIPTLGATREMESGGGRIGAVSCDHDTAELFLGGEPVSYDELVSRCNLHFEPSAGWKGRIEL